MKAEELIKKYIKPEYQNDATVLGLIEDKQPWEHIHLKEEIPTNEKPVICFK